MAESKVDILNNRLGDLEDDFNSWKSHLIDVSDYILPWHGRFLGRDEKFNDGKKRSSNIIEGTATWANGVLAAGMQSGLTSPSRPWFRLGLEDEDLQEYGPVKDWLEETRKVMLKVFQKSNFYHASHAIYQELGGFGTGAEIIEEDLKSVIRCYPFTAGEYYISLDSTGRVDTIARIMWMKARNIVAKFGEENCSHTVKDAYRRQGDKKTSGDKAFRVVHFVQPNPDRMIDRIDKRNKPFMSVYYEYETKDKDKLLRESGYDEFPGMAPRWASVGSDVYGFSPGMIALADVKMLQKMEKKGLIALDKMVDPPLNAPTSMRGAVKTIIPGGVNYIDVNQGQQGFTPTYQLNPNFQQLEYKNEQVRTKIERSFFVNAFLMLDQIERGQITATEVLERKLEKFMMLGPVIERIMPEYLDMAIDRTYNILWKNRMLPPPPPELVEIPLEIEYVSILAQAQKQSETTTIDQLLAYVANAAQLNPEVMDKFDFDESVDQYGDMIGAPNKLIVPDEKVDEIRKIRRKQQQMQQQLETGMAMAQGAKTLSETDTQGDNALTNIIKGLGL